MTISSRHQAVEKVGEKLKDVYSHSQGIILRDRDEVVDVVFAFEGFVTQAKGALASDLRARMQGKGATERLKSLSKVLPWLLPLCQVDDLRPLSLDTLSQGQERGVFFIEVTGNCNERCTHCYAEAGPSVRSSLSRDEILEAVEDAAELGFPMVQFTGGDPLLSKHLVEAVEHAHGLGLDIEIYTNGLLLTEKRLDLLGPFSPSFAFSVYSHIPEFHDQVTRTPGSLKKTLSAIERTVARGLSTRVGLVAMKSNAKLLPKTVDKVRALGVDRVHVTPSFDVGRGEQYQGELPQNATVGHGPNQSFTAKTKLCLNYEGELSPCIFNRSQILGRVGKGRRVRDILESPEVEPSHSSLENFLRECRTQLQCGDCRATATAIYCAQEQRGASDTGTRDEAQLAAREGGGVSPTASVTRDPST